MENEKNINLETKEQEKTEKLNNFLDAIDNVELPDEVLDEMDFYQLSSYIQTLNMLDAVGDAAIGEGDE